MDSCYCCNVPGKILYGNQMYAAGVSVAASYVSWAKRWCHHGKQGLLGKLSYVCMSSITRNSVITSQASDVNSDIFGH